METRRLYSKAPIIEAIIELRVKLPEGVNLTRLEQCGIEESQAYPNKKQTTVAMSQMELGESFSTSTSTKQLGFIFKSADEKQVFQARLDGFALSRLAPYEHWKPFRDEARRLWNVYRKVAQPV